MASRKYKSTKQRRTKQKQRKNKRNTKRFRRNKQYKMRGGQGVILRFKDGNKRVEPSLANNASIKDSIGKIDFFNYLKTKTKEPKYKVENTERILGNKGLYSFFLEDGNEEQYKCDDSNTCLTAEELQNYYNVWHEKRFNSGKGYNFEPGKGYNFENTTLKEIESIITPTMFEQQRGLFEVPQTEEQKQRAETFKNFLTNPWN